MLFEPKQAHHDNKNVDEAEVCQDRDKVDVELLVEVEELDVNPASMLARATTHASQRFNGLIYVLRPDSVEALAPKNVESTADMLPRGKSTAMPSRLMKMM